MNNSLLKGPVAGKQEITDPIEMQVNWNDLNNSNLDYNNELRINNSGGPSQSPEVLTTSSDSDQWPGTWNSDESSEDQTPFWNGSKLTEPIKSANLENLVNLVKTVNSTIFTDPYESASGEKSTTPAKSLIYENGSSIDWIHEYALERARINRLHALTGLHGRLYRLWDSSEVWIVVVGTGIAMGGLASLLNIVTPWLSDIKLGHCSEANYLSKAFCCWGSSRQCKWTPWTLSNIGSYILYILSSIVLASTAALLVKFAPQARFSGIPEIKAILGGYFVHSFMGARILIVKTIGLALVGGAGLWVGKEGPLVHVACCCSSLLLNRFSSLRSNEAKKREIWSSAAAAGISVALGAPIGGVLFSLEQISYYFPSSTMWHSFVCAMISSVTLQMIDPFRTGKMGLFQVVYDRTWYDFEFIPFVLLGVLGGLYGGAFPVLNMMYARARKASEPMLSGSTTGVGSISRVTKAFAYILSSPILEVALLSLITALINYPNWLLKGQTTGLLTSLFKECPTSSSPLSSTLAGPNVTSSLLCGDDELSTILLLLVSSLIAFLLTTYSFGTAVPAGVLMPSMAIGGMTGRALGMIVDNIHRAYPMSRVFLSCPQTAIDSGARCVTPGVYAVVGAASALGGLTRMTVSIVVIMFELTGALYYVLPIMCGVMIAKWVADSFGKRGIYETWIMFSGYPYLPAQKDTPVSVIEMKELFTGIEDLIVIRENQCLASDENTTSNEDALERNDSQEASELSIEFLQNLITTTTVKGFPVITDQGLLVGFISRAQLRFVLDTAIARGLPSYTICYFDKPPVIEESTNTPLLNLSAYLDPTLFTLSEHTTLPLVGDTVSNMGLQYLLFTNSRGQLMGMTTKRDVWRLLNTNSSDLAGREVVMDNSTGMDTEEEQGLLDLEELL
ncbi:hypothetical protein NADFUDRAFT_79986 [Nadsonia fulvescens var. elongata DSM 6958]|uniref:Uncharacterized protein n=1 Tax=Nadsonia fulvescens var. elongata DSM 6958 TaxID=857566 RepID=A0A1E3PEH6_9ASCO|nr:hypothetical protein NADFUDRAFT_79986 [Nadsonia fulvescens var. elongata DSM 6958]